MVEILERINRHRRAFHKIIMDNITEYLYREQRYNIHFALVAVYSLESTAITPAVLQEKLRRTDKLIILNEHLSCIVLDNTETQSYIKAAENLNTLLKEFDYQNNFFLSTAHSTDFSGNLLEMTNKLCDRLKYAIEHKLCNTVVYQDYII